MGLNVALQDESGNEQKVIYDSRNLVPRLIGEPSFCDSPMISLIDRYGDTTFNRLQAQQFLKEWDAVRQRASTPEEKELASNIGELAKVVCDSVHLYLRFIGD